MSNILIDETLLVKSRGSKRRVGQSIAQSTSQNDGHSTDANLLVIDPKQSKPKPVNQTAAKQISKNEARKLTKLAEAKEKKARMANIIQGLIQTKLTPQQQALLSSSGEIGKKETNRQRAAQLVREVNAGIKPAEAKKDSHEIARLKSYQPSDVSLPHMLSRRKIATKRSAPVGSSLVNSFGLDPNRWRDRANDQGSILFDTHRTISYGSDEEEDDDASDDDDDMSMNESDEEHNVRPEVETELSRAIKAASTADANDEEDDEEDDEPALLPAPAPRRDGMFSVAFDVIAASNRPKRQRVALVLPGQKAPEPEPQPEREMSDEEDGEGDDNDEDDNEAMDEDDQEADDSEEASDENNEDDDDDQLQENDEQDEELQSAQSLVLQTVRGKARVEPAKPDRIAQIFAAQGHVTEAGKFARSNRAPLVRIPLAPGVKAYEVNDEEIRVSFNDQRLGESGPGGMEELRTRTKGQSIIETREFNSDDKPRMYTRKLMSAAKGGAPSYVAYCNRLPDIQQSRLSLPITSHEQEIVEALSMHDVLIIQGETGSGKTTQVPQFLLENGFTFGQRSGMIGITQPRRVAAISTAQRVAQELNLPSDRPKNYKFDAAAARAHIEAGRAARAGKGEPLEPGELEVYDPYNTVGYQVRYDSKASQTTRIKFMTDGILLREVSVDFLLRGYSVICVDEAHERGRNTDVLIGLLTRAVQMRSNLFKRYQARLAQTNGIDETPSAVNDSEGKPIVRSPLKLLIMSATLRTEDFLSSTRLFAADAKPRVLTIPARQFPVTVHFNRSTPVDNYLPALLAKVMRMHMKLPDGGILVFVTGKDEIEYLVEKITKCWQEREKRKNKIKLLQDKDKDKVSTSDNDDDSDAEEDTRTEEEKAFDLGDEKSKKSTADLDSQSAVDSEALVQADIDRLFSDPTAKQSLIPHVLPLYSLLPSHLQMRVFEPPPPGHRLIVIATNIAETSLTIPSIGYVLDSGREKRKVWDRVTGCSHFVVDWISAASAEQRKGRAGRTGPGHVYRLYSAAVFDQQFAPHNPPEILREPIESTVLQMKAMGIANIDTFPFPTPPDRHQIKAAELSLTQLGALLPNAAHSITSLGSTLALFPVMPRYAKMLVLAHQGNCLPYVIAIVAALSVEQILLKMKMSEDQSDSDNESGDDYDESNRTSNEKFKKGTAAARAREAKKAKRKRLYDALASARQRWSNPDSDLLTYLRIIGGYEFAVSKAQNHASTKLINQSLKKKYAADFCTQNFIRMKAMEEIELLRKQLSSIAVSVLTGRDQSSGESSEESRGSGDVEAEEDALFNQSKLQSKHAEIITQLASPMQPPSAAQTRLIRQLMTAGLIDRVARKLSEDERRVMQEKSTDSVDWTNSYETLNSPHPAFIHPSSVLFPTSTQPRYLVYHSLQVNQSMKQYMHDCTMIEEETLVTIGADAGLLSWSAFLDEPKPLFNATLDRVEGFKKATLGPKRWELKPQRRPWSDGDNVRHEYLHFARLLLEGAIFESFKKLLPLYCAKPHHLTQPGATVRQALQGVVTKLMQQSIKTRAQLVKIWKKDANFLRPEIELWMQPIALSKLAASWPPK